jgi:hypothetical protein
VQRCRGGGGGGRVAWARGDCPTAVPYGRTLRPCPTAVPYGRAPRPCLTGRGLLRAEASQPHKLLRHVGVPRYA